MTARRDNNKRNSLLRHTFVLAVCSLLALASCRKDRFDDMSGRVTLYPAIASADETVITTRATFPVENTTNTYTDDAPANGTSIRVYAVPTYAADNTSEKKAAGSFRYSNDSWHSSVNAKSEVYYHLYAFNSNNMPGASDLAFNWGVTKDQSNNDVFDLNTVALNFRNLNLFAYIDPMVSVAAAGKLVTDGQPYTAPTLTTGSYDIGQVKTEDGKSYKVWMAMDHLYAKATVSLCIDPTYHEIREIRVKNVKITTTGAVLEGNHSYKFSEAKLVLDQTQGFTGTDYVDLMYGQSAVENRDFPTNPDCDYSTLKEPEQNGDYTEFGWFYFLPNSYITDPQLDYPSVKIHIDYDVYYRDGQPRRLNQEVTDYFPLDKIIRKDGAEIKPKAGDHFLIKVLIKPTYLYQMHDDDEPLELDITGLTNN
jgi:hypothetical protein